MTPAEWKRATIPALDDPSAWTIRNKRVSRRALEWVLAGALGEGSASGGVYVWALSMPLFVPSEHLTLSQSERVVPHTLDANKPAELTAAIRSAVSRAETETAYLNRWADMPATEVGAYSLLILGREAEGRDALTSAIRALRTDGRAWAAENATRVQSLLEVLDERGVDAALAMISTWRDETAKALRL